MCEAQQGLVTRKRVCRAGAGITAAVLVMVGGLPAMPASAALGAIEVMSRPDEAGLVQVPIYKSSVVRLPQAAKRISVGNPGIADIISLRSNQVFVLGKALGNTNITAWDANDDVFASFDVEVTHDLDTLKKKLHELLPSEAVTVRSAQERIVLSGEVSSLVKMNAARDLAQSFLPECVESETSIEVKDAKADSKSGPAGRSGGRSSGQSCKEGGIINLMQVGGAQQVMLSVKVAEMSRTLARQLQTDFNFMRLGTQTAGGLVGGGATFPNALTPDGLEVPILGSLLSGSPNPIGPPVDLFQPNTPSINNFGAFVGHLSGNYYLEAVIDASRNNGLTKILAEPTLTTLTGQEAKFLSGGEFPIPVPQSGGGNGITIEFKEFGVGVKFLPVVLDSGRINMNMAVEVSELSSPTSVALGIAQSSTAFLVPGLTKRSSSATVELGDGQTIGIAGLLNDNLREAVEKLPGIGDIPILGALFRSQQYQSGQTELVIFVTAHLAKPISPEKIKLPTDKFVPPNDLEFYLMGRLEGSKKPKEPVRANPTPTSGGTDAAQFGQQP
jgi:pilus assembly protein CpaC